MCAKQLRAFTVILCLAFAICDGLLVASAVWYSVFEEILTVFPAVSVVLGISAIASFNFIDGISQNITQWRSEISREAYIVAQIKLSALKRKVLYSGALIVVLFICEKATKGASIYLDDNALSWPVASIVVFVGVALITVSFWAGIAQLKCIIAAVQLRDILADDLG